MLVAVCAVTVSVCVINVFINGNFRGLDIYIMFSSIVMVGHYASCPVFNIVVPYYWC